MNKIFISYSHKDEEWKEKVVTHLKVLQAQDLLDVWDDRRIEAGDNWFDEIKEALNNSNIAVLLITANFLTSNFILKEEIPRLLKRRDKEGMRIIPLIVRPCAWKKINWLKSLQARPEDGKALSFYRRHGLDTVLADFTEELYNLLNTATSSKAPANIYLASIPATGDEFFGREQETALLDSAWVDSATHILSLDAWGGVGKTALLKNWLNRMKKDNYRGAVRVYGWSFYSQGAAEGKQASADEFLAYALEWFGDDDPTQGSPWDKGVRLAGLIREERTLLILDGLEPLQYPPGEMQGRLKDQGLQALLKELSHANSGLCIITTRVAVKDIESLVNVNVKSVQLENLSHEAGSLLLRKLGVNGTDSEIQKAVEDFKGHALAITLLGKYLSEAHEGDVKKIGLLPKLTKEKEGGHARRVIRSYEKLLAGKPELNILYLLSLFDRPSEGGAIEILRAEPAIEDLTTELQNLSDGQWNFALKNLRDLGLISEKDPNWPDSLDCHPLIREHFGEKLEKNNPGAWREAHSRLYEYYKNLPEKKLPDTLDEMQPLFAAVAHGCLAGRHQETLDDVYWERISRKNEAYCVKKLGAYGSDLSALSGFFDLPWSKPEPGLKDIFKAAALDWAGFSLRALGRLQEALQPMKAGLKARIAQEDWKNTSISAGNISELSLTTGDVKEAVKYAGQSVEFADKSEDAFQKESKRATLADALNHDGEVSEAEALFMEVENMQKKRQPGLPCLYSVQGFHFCDLLLGRGEYDEVIKRADKALEISDRNKWLLDMALDKLSLGRAYMLKTQAEGGSDFTKAIDFLNQAVDELRKAGGQDDLPRGLLARAALFRVMKDYPKAWNDLNEAKEIAERGGMKLYLADYHLEACRLLIAQKDNQKAKKHLNTAKEMINEMGYHRRDGEVEKIERQVSGVGGQGAEGRGRGSGFRGQKTEN